MQEALLAMSMAVTKTRAGNSRTGVAKGQAKTVTRDFDAVLNAAREETSVTTPDRTDREVQPLQAVTVGSERPAVGTVAVTRTPCNNECEDSPPEEPEEVKETPELTADTIYSFHPELVWQPDPAPWAVNPEIVTAQNLEALTPAELAITTGLQPNFQSLQLTPGDPMLALMKKETEPPVNRQAVGETSSGPRQIDEAQAGFTVWKYLGSTNVKLTPAQVLEESAAPGLSNPTLTGLQGNVVPNPTDPDQTQNGDAFANKVLSIWQTGEAPGIPEESLAVAGLTISNPQVSEQDPDNPKTAASQFIRYRPDGIKPKSAGLHQFETIESLKTDPDLTKETQTDGSWWPSTGEAEPEQLASTLLPSAPTGADLASQLAAKTDRESLFSQADPSQGPSNLNGKDTLAVDPDDLFSQIVTEGKIMVQGGRSEMELSLQPENLGKLKLKIALENQIVTASFTAESEQVKQIIETNLVNLRKLLQDNGIEVENLLVTVGQDYQGSTDPQQPNADGRRSPFHSPFTRNDVSAQIEKSALSGINLATQVDLIA